MTDLKMIEIKKQIEDKEYKWYVLSVTAGQEELVEQNLRERIKNQNLQDDVIDVRNPKKTEVTIKKKKGKIGEGPKEEKVVKQKKIYPGYLFFKSRMNDKIWYVVRNTPGVRLIVGAETKPISLTPAEYQKIVDQIKESETLSNKSWEAGDENAFKVGDPVQVLSGDLKDMQDLTIKEILYNEKKVIVT
jgi:transcriptional antiterminator NusG